MNPPPTLLTAVPAPQPAPSPPAPIQNHNSNGDSKNVGRRNGKIAHLPAAQRALINHLFDQGTTYQAVSLKMAEQGVSLNLTNIHAWFHGGYQDYLQDCERRRQLHDLQEQLLQIARTDHAPALSSVGLQLAVTQLARQLYQIAPGSHQESFQTDTHHYLRMLNTLARLTKALLALQKYQDDAARSKAVELKEKDPARDLSDSEYSLLVNQMDRVFRMPRRPQSSSSPVAPDKPQNQKPKIENSSYPDSVAPPGSPAESPVSAKTEMPHSESPSPTPSTLSPPQQSPDDKENPDPYSKIDHPEEMPAACALCGSNPLSFSIRPLPPPCRLCNICPVKPEPAPNTT